MLPRGLYAHRPGAGHDPPHQRRRLDAPARGHRRRTGAVAAHRALAFRDYHRLKRYKYTLAAFGFALILGTKFFGVDPYGEGYKRWFGFHGLYYQPVELLKVLLVIFFAAYLDEKHEVLANAYLRAGPPAPAAAAIRRPAVHHLAAGAGPAAFQNDLGSALLFFGIFLAMVYIASPRVIYSLMGLVLVVAGAAGGLPLQQPRARAHHHLDQPVALRHGSLSPAPQRLVATRCRR